MKNRKVITNILYVITLIMLAAFLLLQFNILPIENEDTQELVAAILLAVAIFCVFVVEIVFPICFNIKKLKENRKYLLLAIAKVVLFLAAAFILFAYQPFGIIKEMTVSLIGFVILYFVQFFINLDPKTTKSEEIEETSDDEEDQNDENYENEEAEYDPSESKKTMKEDAVKSNASKIIEADDDDVMFFEEESDSAANADTDDSDF